MSPGDQRVLITSSSEGVPIVQYIVLVVIPKKVEKYLGCFVKRWYVAFVLLVTFRLQRSIGLKYWSITNKGNSDLDTLE